LYAPNNFEIDAVIINIPLDCFLQRNTRKQEKIPMSRTQKYGEWIFFAVDAVVRSKNKQETT